MSEQLSSVAEICELPAGDKENPSWVNGGFIGICRKIEMRTYGEGKKMWPCSIGDTTGSATVEVTFFTAPKFSEGDLVEFSGKGMRRTEFKGRAQVAIGKDTEVHVSAGKPRVEAAARIPAAQHAAAAESHNGALLNGAQVGGAVKSIFEAMTQGLTSKDSAIVMSEPVFWRKLHEHASDYVRVCQMMEHGKLAPSVRERQNAHSNPPPAAPKHNPEQELDSQEEVPF